MEPVLVHWCYRPAWHAGLRRQHLKLGRRLVWLEMQALGHQQLLQGQTVEANMPMVADPLFSSPVMTVSCEFSDLET